MAGYLTGWNAGAEALFGYTASEALGRHALLLDADDAFEPGMAELLMAQDGAPVDVRRRTKSGEVIRVALSLMLDACGDAAGMRVLLAPAA